MNSGSRNATNDGDQSVEYQNQSPLNYHDYLEEAQLAAYQAIIQHKSPNQSSNHSDDSVDKVY